MRKKAIPETLHWPVCALASTRRAARLLTQLYDSYLADYGIEAGQFALLMMVEHMATKGQTAIAHALGMDKTTLSRNLKVLRQRGWVESETGSGDGRRRELSLTAEGRVMLTQARPGWRRAQEALRRHLKGMEWLQLLETMEGVSQAAVDAGTAKK
ncbi:MarR family winged helix-turn-helix transcriptional regulator [Edaphobacter flagellatus]|uniref:MarR family winged helix-turn-helix transcriptional regulator n=1 Tax=Edaphobacter flagellatus TaxID=1933044 RepID=UPI0021B1CB67|nr:MarR family winged helix-turn-helix transcriptional regulator [Edaphobacter flagellatus]